MYAVFLNTSLHYIYSQYCNFSLGSNGKRTYRKLCLASHEINIIMAITTKYSIGRQTEYLTISKSIAHFKKMTHIFLYNDHVPILAFKHLASVLHHSFSFSSINKSIETF